MTHIAEFARGGVRVLALDREPLNLISPEMVRALAHAFAEHRTTDPLVITGANDLFSAGVDTRIYGTLRPQQRVAFARDISLMTRNALSLRGPLVAAIPGHAIGGGFVLPLCADYRLAARKSNARFALAEAAAGVAFPAGPACIVQHEIPMPLLRFMTMSGQPLSREELIAARVFDESVEREDLLNRAVEVAQNLSAQPAFGLVKQQIRGPLMDAVAQAANDRKEVAFD